jgi:hypothetical protein
MEKGIVGIKVVCRVAFFHSLVKFLGRQMHTTLRVVIQSKHAVLKTALFRLRSKISGNI